MGVLDPSREPVIVAAARTPSGKPSVAAWQPSGPMKWRLQ